MRSVGRLIQRPMAAVTVCAGLLGVAGPSPAAADSSWHTYSNASGARAYLLEVPATMPADPPLVVFLHGCNQTAAGVAHDTGWANLADEYGFVAVFPQEPPLPSDTVLRGCWGWEQSGNQHRGSGEPSIIAGITDQVATAEHVDRRRIYIAGFSAGGYMANIMAVTYPDLYAAAGIVAGGPYGLSTAEAPDASGQAIVDEMGPRKRAVPVVVVQATNDNINPFPAGFAAVQQWLDAYDLIDDGQRNDSVSRVPASVEAYAALAAPNPTAPTICDQLAPCLGGATGLARYPYTIAHYLDALRRPLLDFFTIAGANHDYTGGSGTFMDPTGPSTTAATHAFLFAQRR
jgi:poly(hydroxyalkanoate) depolymerase family esterase